RLDGQAALAHRAVASLFGEEVGPLPLRHVGLDLGAEVCLDGGQVAARQQPVEVPHHLVRPGAVEGLPREQGEEWGVVVVAQRHGGLPTGQGGLRRNGPGRYSIRQRRVDGWEPTASTPSSSATPSAPGCTCSGACGRPTPRPSCGAWRGATGSGSGAWAASGCAWWCSTPPAAPSTPSPPTPPTCWKPSACSTTAPSTC